MAKIVIDGVEFDVGEDELTPTQPAQPAPIPNVGVTLNSTVSSRWFNESSEGTLSWATPEPVTVDPRIYAQPFDPSGPPPRIRTEPRRRSFVEEVRRVLNSARIDEHISIVTLSGLTSIPQQELYNIIMTGSVVPTMTQIESICRVIGIRLQVIAVPVPPSPEEPNEETTD